MQLLYPHRSAVHTPGTQGEDWLRRMHAKGSAHLTLEPEGWLLETLRESDGTSGAPPGRWR
eukprot:480435-Amphidinium_carterae.1